MTPISTEIPSTAPQVYTIERREGRSHEEARERAAHAFGYHLGSPAQAEQLDDLLVRARDEVEQRPVGDSPLEAA
jgi:hypothetical protein